eukprot:COSAG01_NODE_3108_length_6574_cov_59.780077_5_plen_63_part_00
MYRNTMAVTSQLNPQSESILTNDLCVGSVVFVMHRLPSTICPLHAWSYDLSVEGVFSPCILF